MICGQFCILMYVGILGMEFDITHNGVDIPGCLSGTHSSVLSYRKLLGCNLDFIPGGDVVCYSAFFEAKGSQ